jgi:hypothetical protein
MLDLGMVPVSVERTIGRRPAAVTWWIDNVEMMELERRRLGRQPADPNSWNDQMNRMGVFQELVSNSDCNQTNILITRDWRVCMVDFTRAFRVHRRLMRPESLSRLDPRLRSALERLDEASLLTEMKGLLSAPQVRGILARRDLILSHFDGHQLAASMRRSLDRSRTSSRWLSSHSRDHRDRVWARGSVE